MKLLKSIKLIFVLTVLMFGVKAIQAQTYQYLKIIVDTSYNLDIVELDWIANNTTYPQAAMTGWNAPAPLRVTGNRANWERTRLYDNTNLDCRVGNIEVNNPIKHEFTLDLGSGNGIAPDSLRLQKTNNSSLARFRVLLSNDEENWFLFLDTSINFWQWATLTFPLSRVPDIVPPSKPLQLTSTYRNSSSFHFNWNKSTDNFAIQHYNVFLNNQIVANTNETHFVVKGLAPNIQSSVFVQAVDGDNNVSENSDTLMVTTLALDNTNPILMGPLFASSISSQTIAIRWTEATDNLGLSGYLISVNGEYTASSDSAFTVLSGLNPSETYQIAVIAKDRSGNISAPISNSFQTRPSKEVMKLGTNFWRQQWSPSNNQLFNNGYQSVDEENPWKPQVIEDLSYARTLRFMEMQQINIAPLDNWVNRQHKEDLEQADLAYEWMIDLCNRTDKDLWICIPWNVIDSAGIRSESNGLITKLAVLLKTGIDMGSVILNEDSIGQLNELTANDFLLLGGKKTTEPLKPGLKIFLEYSNENWNWNFPQAIHCMTHGIARGYGGPVRANRLFNAYASLQTFKAFARVFGKNSGRIEKVLPIQTTNGFYTNLSFTDVFDDIAINPDSIYPNIVSGATYFSHSRDGNDPNIFTLMEEDINNNITNVIAFRDNMANWSAARNISLRMVSYEGGHHVNTNYNSINTDPRIYDTYMHYLDTLSYYFEEIELYNHVAYNAFGLKASVDQPLADAHKFRAVLDWKNLQDPGVLFTKLKGELSDSNVLLSWSTLKEFPNAPGFTLWHSTDGVVFDSIESIASQTRPTPPTLYAHTDSGISSGVHYYMVSQANTVGVHCYSNTIGVNRAEPQANNVKQLIPSLILYPNPTKGIVNLTSQLSRSGAPLTIYNSNGVMVKHYSKTPEQIQLTEMPAGIYFLRIQNQTIRIQKK